MKKTVLGLIILFFSFFANAQSFTAGELVTYADCMYFECFNSAVIKKGFTLADSKMQNTGDSLEAYVFSHKEYSVKDVISYAVSKNRKRTYVNFATPNEDSYSILLAGFLQKGFVFAKTINSSNGVTSVYTFKNDGKTFLQVSTSRVANLGATKYDFTLEKVHRL